MTLTAPQLFNCPASTVPDDRPPLFDDGQVYPIARFIYKIINSIFPSSYERNALRIRLIYIGCIVAMAGRLPNVAEAVLYRREDLAQPWSTCGGHGYDGPTTCVPNYICAYVEKWYSQCISSALPEFQKTCASSGQAEADIAGIGVLVALGLQTGFSFLFMILVGKISSLDYVGGKMLVALNCLLAIIDTQIITAIALIISALSTWRSLSLYHFHVVYDMISISCVFIWPELYQVSAAMSKMPNRPAFSLRAFTSIVLLVLYATLTGLLGLRLREWDPNLPGNCFEGNTFLRPTGDSSRHAFSLGVLAFFFIAPYLYTLFLSYSCRNGDEKFQKNIYLGVLCVLSILLLSAHASFIRVLRRHDQHFLPPGGSENQWTFGQIVVVFSFIPIIMQLYLELRAYKLGKGATKERSRVAVELSPGSTSRQ